MDSNRFVHLSDLIGYDNQRVASHTDVKKELAREYLNQPEQE